MDAVRRSDVLAAATLEGAAYQQPLLGAWVWEVGWEGGVVTVEGVTKLVEVVH